MEVRFLGRASKRLRLSSRLSHSQPPRPRAPRRFASTKPRPEQAHPVGGFYEFLLSDPLPTIKNVIEQPTPPETPPPMQQSAKDEIAAKAKIVFGSTLAGPAERKADIKGKSVMLHGVLVPPKPEEPDNCCMSGCVNCVWDRYRDEYEEYAAARKQAEANRMKEQSESSTVATMDDDGGGSNTILTALTDPEIEGDDLFKNVPVGIREFMKQEKRLKEKHAANGTKGG